MQWRFVPPCRGCSSVWLATGLLAFGPIPRSTAADVETEPFPGLRYVHRHVTEPREIDMHVVIVDLRRPGVADLSSMAGNVRLIREGTILAGQGGDATYPQTAIGHTPPTTGSSSSCPTAASLGSSPT